MIHLLDCLTRLFAPLAAAWDQECGPRPSATAPVPAREEDREEEKAAQPDTPPVVPPSDAGIPATEPPTYPLRGDGEPPSRFVRVGQGRSARYRPAPADAPAATLYVRNPDPAARPRYTPLTTPEVPDAADRLQRGARRADRAAGGGLDSQPRRGGR